MPRRNKKKQEEGRNKLVNCEFFNVLSKMSMI